MPTSIPYDPTLVLGNIVDDEKIKTLEAIADLQKPVDAAQEEMNSLILWKRSLDMTVQEMINMNVDDKELDPLNKEIDQIKTAMVKAATTLGAAVIKSEQGISQLKSSTTQTKISDNVESPIDYTKSQLKSMPLSSDSMVMDAQYFRFEQEKDTAESHATSIATYVAQQSSNIFGMKESSKIGASANAAANTNATNHKIEGTLVITANCTHKQAEVFAPFVLDVDKAIRAWNAYGKGTHIDMDDPASVAKIAMDPKSDDAQMQLLSGATFGSSFVGMVHILQTEDTESTQAAISAATSLTGQMSLGAWFAKESGEFGVDASFADSVKSLLSNSNLTSHCSVITMGIIPSIKSNEVATSVKKLAGDPSTYMDQLATIQGSSNSDLTTVASAAAASKEGQSLSTLSTDYMKAAVSALGSIDTANNQVIDTNSMMTAFDDYVQKAIAGEAGVPINFFLKPITARQIAKLWVNKYYPNQFKTGESQEGEDASGEQEAA